jgi:hypothetical protein
MPRCCTKATDFYLHRQIAELDLARRPRRTTPGLPFA